MRRYYIISRVLLILPIIDFAVAAPTLVQEKRRAGVNAVHLVPGDAITMLGKRGGEFNELWLKYLSHWENHFADPEPSAIRPPSSLPPSEPADGWTNLKQPLPSIPEEPSTVSSPDHAPPSPGSLTESGNGLMRGHSDAPGPFSPQAVSSTMSSADHALMGPHALPNPGPSTEPDHEMVDVLPPPSLASPIESDIEMVDASVPPWPGSASPVESDIEMVDASVPPLPRSASPMA